MVQNIGVTDEESCDGLEHGVQTPGSRNLKLRVCSL
jgi:hypothetical protein